MAALPAQGESNEFKQNDQDDSPAPTIFHNTFQQSDEQTEMQPGELDVEMPLAYNYTPPAPALMSAPAPVIPQLPPTQQSMHQALLPGAAIPGLPASSSKLDRCALCTKNWRTCNKRFDCPGKGNRKSCRCNHPSLASGEKVRISEETIRATKQREAGQS